MTPTLLFADAPPLTAAQRGWLGLVAAGLLALALCLADVARAGWWLGAALALTSAGTLGWSRATFGATRPAGVHLDGIWTQGSSARGALAWITGLLLTAFYVILYWFSGNDGNGNFGLLSPVIHALDGFSQALRGRAADQWFLYGTFYTLAVGLMGARAMFKYRHTRYHLLRTGSLVFFQLGFAYLLPGLLLFFQQPEFYFTYFWPLKHNYLFPSDMRALASGPGLGVFLVVWGAVMSFAATPVLTYFFGKRWYCSWVCGCGGLAETAGDPYRHLADKSQAAWRLEVRLVYPILGLITLITVLLWLGAAGKLPAWATTAHPAPLAFFSNVSPLDALSKTYGFVVGAVFSGVVGVGFYPILGARVWCRFGCPMAAYLGLLQKHFSRFRISTNGGQCISCGNCSNICEMGIDVKQYAQRGEPIIRASCVGCGMCATACPRGVLKLENGPVAGRYAASVLIAPESLRLLS